jgi:hypothetical protein
MVMVGLSWIEVVGVFCVGERSPAASNVVGKSAVLVRISSSPHGCGWNLFRCLARARDVNIKRHLTLNWLLHTRRTIERIDSHPSVTVVGRT